MNYQKSIISKFASAEDYINTSFKTFKVKNPKLTKRQIYIKLQDQWNQELKKYQSNPKVKEQPPIKEPDENYEIYIPIEPQNNQTKNQANKKKKKNYKKKKQSNKQNQNLSKSVMVKEIPEVSSISLDIHSLEERVSKIKIDVVNVPQTKQSENQRIQKYNIKKENNKNNYKKNQSSKDNKKLQKVNLKSMEQTLQPIDFENVSQEKPIPVQDFINSANFIDHISIIKIQKNKTSQGQVEIDKIKSIVSHTYGLVAHQNDTSNLNLQLFFQVEFQPRNDGTQPDDTFCTAKQAALYNKELVLEYLNNHKNIFSKDSEYYIS